MQLMNIEWKWNIPNLLSLLRILLVPVFVILYLLSSDERMDLMYWSFGVLILSGVTDSLDGIIARKCNQITDLGKLLDPVADKLTQVAVVICLATRFSQLIPLVVICFVKELAQSIGGLILLRRGAEVRGASWYGKMCTFLRGDGPHRPAAQYVLVGAGASGDPRRRSDAVRLLQLYEGLPEHQKDAPQKRGRLQIQRRSGG